MRKGLVGNIAMVNLIRIGRKKMAKSKYLLSFCPGYARDERMKNIFNIQIEREAERFPAFPWNVKVETPIFSIQKRFVLISEVLAWLVKKVEEE